MASLDGQPSQPWAMICWYSLCVVLWSSESFKKNIENQAMRSSNMLLHHIRDSNAWPFYNCQQGNWRGIIKSHLAFRCAATGLQHVEAWPTTVNMSWNLHAPLVVEPTQLKHSQILSFPQGSGWKFQKMFELPPPGILLNTMSNLGYHL